MKSSKVDCRGIAAGTHYVTGVSLPIGSPNQTNCGNHCYADKNRGSEDVFVSSSDPRLGLEWTIRHRLAHLGWVRDFSWRIVSMERGDSAAC